MIPIDEARLSRSFGSTTLERAAEYVRKGRVLEAYVEPSGTIRGTVKGSEWKPYVQRITVTPSVIDGLCTCPVGENCKHVAAVLLNLMGEDEVVETPPAKLDVNVSGWLKTVEEQFAGPNDYPAGMAQRVFYLLLPDDKGVTLEIVTTRALAAGGYGKPTRLALNGIYSNSWPPHVLPIDAHLIGSIARSLARTGGESKFRIVGTDGARLLPEILATERVAWSSVNEPLLKRGPDRSAEFIWSESLDGSQTLRLATEGLIPVGTIPPWYIDPDASECGELSVDLPANLIGTLIQAPALRPESVPAVRETLARLLPNRPDLLPAERWVEHRQVRPTPILQIALRPCTIISPHAWRLPVKDKEHLLPVAKLVFDYDGIEVRQNVVGSEVRKLQEGGVVVMPRRQGLEGRASTPLLEGGWMPARNAHTWKLPKGYGEDYLFRPESDARPDSYRLPFYRFIRTVVPTLIEQGWRVEIEGDVQISEPTDWHIDVRETGADWFSLDLGVIVDGEQIPLLPILLSALSGTQGKRLDGMTDDAEIFHELPSGKILVLPAARLRPLLKTLSELFGKPSEWSEELRMLRAQAGELALLDQAGLEWAAPEWLLEMSERLSDFEGLKEVPTPASLKGDLRPYQQQGLAWLQFLREFEFGGILADDMGLGKTVQTLAHILVEQEAGRLDRPVLIVAPTSTLPNWRAEAAKFAPSLRTLVLRGSDRKELYAEIDDHDLIVTSYPILARDREEWKKHEFHIVVLDEAQNIKNPSSAAAKAAGELKSRHKVCLSGTPVENRLEELWSLFNFAMPGFLGGITAFRKNFKVPIEGKGEEEAGQRLSRRIRPFVLRRTKDLVATELPEKTTVVERVELTGEQRDLYESLRLSMDEQVRSLLKAKGFDRSRIEILSALLKLRQACCDPRLIKLESAQNVEGSAKLERLMELLIELLAEGRRVLLFSQFTSMLDLIEVELVKSKIEWVRISGDTEDRETPVRQFQAGEVPLFLISLRAGGTGLNLTAADTVIHYDPWWNPAVENQATDRAHRIGQTKSVLVLKLVAEGTVEEKILELQDKKSRLAESVLSGGDFEAGLTAEELRSIFEA
jgi:superfamily II DNA or RNA helicase